MTIAVDGCLLLGLADHHRAVVTVEVLQVFVEHVLLADSSLEGDDWHVVLLGEMLEALHERPGHAGHDQRGGKGFAAVLPKEQADPAATLQDRNVDVQIQQVDAFGLKGARIRRLVVPLRADAPSSTTI